ncbi:MAG: ATP-binding cassette domain-containing protein [Bacteroidia bacterium]|nr:ATP-binding cassette domain-containing protein [Bacteroidia bacterium]
MAGPRPDRDMPKAKISRESIKESLILFRYLKPYRGYFIGGLVFIALSAVSTMLFPFLVGQMVNAATGTTQGSQMTGSLSKAFNGINFKPSTWSLNTILLLVFIQLGFQFLFSYMRLYMLSQSGTKATADLRKDLFSKLLNLPLSFFSSQKVGELNSRIAADTGQIQDTISFVLAEFLRGIMTLIIGIFLIFYISQKLAFIMLAIVPLLAILAVAFGRQIRGLSRKETDMLAESGNVVNEALHGITVVKAFTSEKLETKRYQSSISELVNFAIKNATYRGLFVSSMIFTVFGAIAFVIWEGANMIHAGTLENGDLVAFVVYSAFVGGTFAGFADMFSQVQKTIGATQRVREILRESNESELWSTLASTNSENIHLKGNIEVKDVHFSYPSRQDVEVLKGISFEVKAGQQIALVGSSGSGKSTIAQLLLAFYKPGKGSISFDGMPAENFTLEQLRQNLALVPQDILLFGGTVYENILYGNSAATLNQVEEAAKRANAHNFITGFPEGYQTMVGERGIQLSGGQRQRIAIARAILKDPAILILDEATSSLDSESEKLVQDALDELMKGRTSIVIAHRLSTIRNADKILVLDKGTIIEQGTHEALTAIEHGMYRHLSSLQFDFPEKTSFSSLSK